MIFNTSLHLLNSWLPVYLHSRVKSISSLRYFPIYFIIWIRHSLQASIASTHRHVQIVVLGSFLHYSWLFFFVLQFDLPSYFYCKGDISGRLFCRAERYRGRLFFRGDRSLGAKQEGLTIVHFINKLIVSCIETVRFPF